MNEAEIAHKILNRRNAQSPVVMVGELQQDLGPDGYTLALERRWIEPNYESGELNITNQQTHLDEMRELAKTVKVEPVAESKDRGLYRMYQTNQPRNIHQTAAGLFEDDADGAQIGDEVVVAEDGKPFNAVVKAKNPDGTYSLSFGQDKPRQDRPYKSDELRKTSTDANTTSKTTSQAPVAPGVQPTAT